MLIQSQEYIAFLRNTFQIKSSQCYASISGMTIWLYFIAVSNHHNKRHVVVITVHHDSNSKQRHLQLLSIAQKRIQPCTHDVSHNQLKSLVSSLSRAHTHTHTVTGRRFGCEFRLVGVRLWWRRLSDGWQKERERACSADTSCSNDQEMTINSRPNHTIYRPKHS